MIDMKAVEPAYSSSRGIWIIRYPWLFIVLGVQRAILIADDPVNARNFHISAPYLWVSVFRSKFLVKWAHCVLLRAQLRIFMFDALSWELDIHQKFRLRRSLEILMKDFGPGFVA